MLPASQLRARPDFYVKRLRTKAHKETVRSKQEIVRLHKAYAKDIKRIAKSDLNAVQMSRAFERIATEFCDRFEERLRRRVGSVMESTAQETQRITNLCLPKGVDAPGESAVLDYWTTDFKGQTPDERLARVRLKTIKKMRSVTSHTFVEADFKAARLIERQAGEAWESTEAIAAQVAGNEPWIASLLAQAKTYESNEDVIDHYEILATLDALTCDECGALDGQVIEGNEFGNPIAMTEHIDVHPNCRCTVVPVTKTWEELGFKGIEEPEGTRIARTDYPIVDENGKKDWGKSAPGPDSNQGYVPADTRFSDWKGEQ